MLANLLLFLLLRIFLSHIRSLARLQKFGTQAPIIFARNAPVRHSCVLVCTLRCEDPARGVDTCCPTCVTCVLVVSPLVQQLAPIRHCLMPANPRCVTCGRRPYLDDVGVSRTWHRATAAATLTEVAQVDGQRGFFIHDTTSTLVSPSNSRVIRMQRCTFAVVPVSTARHKDFHKQATCQWCGLSSVKMALCGDMRALKVLRRSVASSDRGN